MRARRLVTVAVAAAMLAPLAACTGDDAPPPTTEATTTTTEVPLATPPELLDAGAEPRQALRIDYRTGEEIVLRTAVDLAVEQEADGRRQRLDSPPIVQLVHLTVGEVAGGETELALAIDAVTVDGRSSDLAADDLAALQAAVDPLTEVTGTIRIDELGRTLAVDLRLPDTLAKEARQALESLRDQLRQLTPALPKEDVGVGARWTSSSDATGLAGAGVEGRMVQTVTVIAIDEGRITYDTTVELLAEPQELALDGGEPARATAIEVLGRAKGWYEVDSPAQEADVRTTATLALELGDDPVTSVDQRTTTVVRISSQAP